MSYINITTNPILLLFLACLLLTTQCNVQKDVEFIKIEDVEVERLNVNMIKLKAISVYNNPNPVSITIDSWDINVTANGVDVAKVDLDIPTEIPANGYFLIPITIQFPPKSVIKVKGGIIAGVLSAIKNKSIKLLYDGHIYVDLLGKKVPVQVYSEKDINF